MAHDERLAERIRRLLAREKGVTERRMFGGLAFMDRNGHMFAGILDDVLMARVGPDAYSGALAEPHVRVMDFTGRALRGYVYVDPPGIAQDARLGEWLARCLAFVASLPPKPRR